MRPKKPSDITRHSRLIWLYGVGGVYPRDRKELIALTGISKRIMDKYMPEWDAEREALAKERFMESEIALQGEANRKQHLQHIRCIEGQMKAIEVRLDMLDVEDKEYWRLSDKYTTLKQEWEKDTGMLGMKAAASKVELVKGLIDYQKDTGVQMLPAPEDNAPPELNMKPAKGRSVGMEFDV